MSPDNSSSLVEVQDLGEGLVKITLNDPSHQNILSEKMIDELQATFDDLSTGPSRVLILSST